MKLYRRVGKAIWVLGIFLLAVGLKVQAETPNYLLVDDFEGGSLGAGLWNVIEYAPKFDQVDGFWVIKGGTDTANRCGIGRYNVNWTDYEVEVRAKWSGATRGNNVQDHFLIGVRHDPVAMTGYLFGMKKVAGGPILVVNKYNDHTSNSNRVQDSSDQVPTNEWFIFRVRVVGDELTAYINDHQLVKATTDISDAPSGGIRITHVGYDVDIDYAKVTNLGPPEGISPENSLIEIIK